MLHIIFAANCKYSSSNLLLWIPPLAGHQLGLMLYSRSNPLLWNWRPPLTLTGHHQSDAYPHLHPLSIIQLMTSPMTLQRPIKNASSFLKKNSQHFDMHVLHCCYLQTPCCNGLYRCRFCHDEAEDHTLTRWRIFSWKVGVKQNWLNTLTSEFPTKVIIFDNREDVVTVECCDCKLRQGVNENCENCGLKFGQVVRLRILALRLFSILFVHIPDCCIFFSDLVFSLCKLAFSKWNLTVSHGI